MNGQFRMWLAGFFEGDGSVSCRYKLDNRGYYSLNPSTEVLERLRTGDVRSWVIQSSLRGCRGTKIKQGGY